MPQLIFSLVNNKPTFPDQTGYLPLDQLGRHLVDRGGFPAAQEAASWTEGANDESANGSVLVFTLCSALSGCGGAGRGCRSQLHMDENQV